MVDPFQGQVPRYYYYYYYYFYDYYVYCYYSGSCPFLLIFFLKLIRFRDLYLGLNSQGTWVPALLLLQFLLRCSDIDVLNCA